MEIIIVLSIEHATLDERHQDSLIVFFAFFFNYSVPQYTILLTSKLISFCATLVNPLGSHTLSFTAYFYFNYRIQILLICTLSTFFWSALLSLLSTLLSLVICTFSVHKDLSARETWGVTSLLSVIWLIDCWRVPIAVALNFQIFPLITPYRCDLKSDLVSAP